jgi:(E)-4-hydroxy-3-methylbut-2-enyl-diphosphate synthase
VIRIGSNLGSLSQRIISRHGHTPQAMVTSAMEFLQIFEELDFRNTVISLKASNPLITTHAYWLLAKQMLEKNIHYPLHLGVTEAGSGQSGRIKSAMGITALLNMGLGDTIRVSLTEEPENEIPFAAGIARHYDGKWQQSEYHLPEFDPLPRFQPELPSGHKAIVIDTLNSQDPTTLLNKTINADLVFTADPGNYLPAGQLLLPAGSTKHEKQKSIYPYFETAPATGFHPEFNFVKITEGTDLSSLEKIPRLVVVPEISSEAASCDFGKLSKAFVEKGINAAIIPRIKTSIIEEDELIVYLSRLTSTALLQKQVHGLWVEGPPDSAQVSFGMLQASGQRITSTEFISCPTCSRTSFDLLKIAEELKQKCSNLPGIKIAVMGCVVNGPGEMADADYGILGTASGKVHIYKGQSPILKNVEPAMAVKLLMENL